VTEKLETSNSFSSIFSGNKEILHLFFKEIPFVFLCFMESTLVQQRPGARDEPGAADPEIAERL
jgi:hypothetical protein